MYTISLTLAAFVIYVRLSGFNIFGPPWHFLTLGSYDWGNMQSRNVAHFKGGVTYVLQNQILIKNVKIQISIQWSEDLQATLFRWCFFCLHTLNLESTRMYFPSILSLEWMCFIHHIYAMLLETQYSVYEDEAHAQRGSEGKMWKVDRMFQDLLARWRWLPHLSLGFCQGLFLILPNHLSSFFLAIFALVSSLVKSLCKI